MPICISSHYVDIIYFLYIIILYTFCPLHLFPSSSFCSQKNELQPSRKLKLTDFFSFLLFTDSFYSPRQRQSHKKNEFVATEKNTHAVTIWPFNYNKTKNTPQYDVWLRVCVFVSAYNDDVYTNIIHIQKSFNLFFFAILISVLCIKL